MKTTKTTFTRKRHENEQLKSHCNICISEDFEGVYFFLTFILIHDQKLDFCFRLGT